MHIVYVGPFSYPSSNANSMRIQGVVNALVKRNHRITVCPGIESTCSNADLSASPHVTIHQLDEYGQGFCSGLTSGVRGLFLGDVTLRWLKSLPKQPDAVILYGTHLGYLLRLLQYCKLKSIKLFLDVVEWYDPSHLPGGPIGPFAISNELSMRWAVPRADGHLVISSYLENYYRAKGCRTLRTPPLFSDFSVRPKQLCGRDDALTLCYVGTPGRKEDFETLFRGVQLALHAGINLKLHFIGLTKSALPQKHRTTATELNKKYNEAFIFYGHLPNTTAKKLIAASDFMLLIRQPHRFANAGFPFKIAESMSLGTPVITNQFSDIPQYLVDKDNALIIPKLTAVDVFNCIARAYNLGERELCRMRESARSKAQEVFSTEARANEISSFIQSGR